MYQYDQYDRQLVTERVAEFRDQVQRRLSGELTEEEFLPLRLQNGLYMQKHAYMLRVAIPYGTLSSQQLRVLAQIARRYDRDYGHLTTRQNIQFNWIALEQVPNILELLASVNMHAIQTSGNCVRNITTEQFAGVAEDEIQDPRPFAEIIRQWSTFNPEFLYLPRKFKIAISSAQLDRAAVQTHDVGLYLHKNERGESVFRVLAGGGLGRTPILSSVIREALPWQHVLSYLEAVLRVYNRYGRRDNKYKARIKILVKSLGVDAFAAEVESEWRHLKDSSAVLTQEELERVSSYFQPPPYEPNPGLQDEVSSLITGDNGFSRWLSRNVHRHKQAGYASVTISTKPGLAMPPGDVTAEQMEAVAGWADAFGFSEIRITHEQNLVLPDVKKKDLPALWEEAQRCGLATANVGLISDVIACPGGDYCSLANARSISVAQSIQERFSELDFIHDLGDLNLNISGCVNACGHHHVGNIGILGVDKDGKEWYQLTLGGSQGNKSSIGKVLGRSFQADEVPDVIEKIVSVFCELRLTEEPFIETVRRTGLKPFQLAVYGEPKKRTSV